MTAPHHRAPAMARPVRAADRQRTRNRVWTTAALALTAAGFVLAALEPPWLVGPLQDLLAASGAAGPAAFVLLCVVAAPAHLCGVLVALSVLVWPVPVAAALSFTGTLLGCLATAGVLTLLGAGSARARDGWPTWLERTAARVARRPVLVGLTLRVVLQTGVAVEGFYLLTGYTRRHYLLVTTVGLAVWVAQTLLGVAALGALVEVSPWLGMLLVVVPLAAGAGAVLVARRRARPAARP